ncbi:DNA repair protein RecO [Roseburia inulinivorans]
MGQNLVVTGMVLNAMPIGDYDKRITLLTRERGKITAFARGARKPNSQFLAATNPFSFGEFELFEGRSTYTVAKVSIQNYFRELASDFDAAYYGFYFLEFADYYCQENNDETEMLKLLYQTLRALESPAFSNRLVRCIYELKTLTINGEAPNVFGCTKCGKKKELHWFSGKTARMLCDHCVNELRRKPENMAALPTYQKVQESTVYTMQYIMTAKLAKLYTFSVSDQVLWELQQCIREYMKYYINHSFKSLKILEEVENMI